ncbi:hypothetical protein WL09_29900 [Burkholderia ubonensis]|nr:hypothetical protein [Burkholderia ubonensis]KVC93351.1 hypothetical protein WI76_27820 [Burkholderia ubonensis]KVX95708.1 hypothetical protein WL09_29900 [Burkholderia ubonensis]
MIYTALKRALLAGVVHAGESVERARAASFRMRGPRMRAMSRGAGSSTNASVPSRYCACCANVSRFSKATRIFS